MKGKSHRPPVTRWATRDGSNGHGRAWAARDHGRRLRSRAGRRHWPAQHGQCFAPSLRPKSWAKILGQILGPNSWAKFLGQGRLAPKPHLRPSLIPATSGSNGRESQDRSGAVDHARALRRKPSSLAESVIPGRSTARTALIRQATRRQYRSLRLQTRSQPHVACMQSPGCTNSRLLPSAKRAHKSPISKQHCCLFAIVWQ